MAAAGEVITTADFPAAQRGNGEERIPGPAFKKVSEKLIKLMKSVNIAEDLEADELALLGRRVVDQYNIDKASRSDWEERNEKALKLAMQVAEPKNHPWPGASNVMYPLLTTAAIQFAARAYPAIVQGKDVVKGKVVGSDDGLPVIGEDGQPVMQPPDPNDPEGQPQPQWQIPPGAKRAKAERIARHMSYQLIEEMEDWEEDTDKLLHMLPIIGCVFRKTYFSREQGHNVSEMVPAMKLVVNNGTRSLATVPRITQEFELYPYQITERVRDGLFLDIEMGSPPQAPEDEDAEHDFLEQHRFIDLDDDDYPEPYIVTVHKETVKVVRIVANYDEKSVFTNEKGEVSKIRRVEYFTKYPFLPAPDGSFYDIGFGILLGPISASVNTSLNQMLDAGHLQNMGGGFIGRGARIKAGPLRFRPGEWKPVNISGRALKDNIFPFPAGGPSPVLFQLLGLLIEAGKEISSVKDVLTGESPAGANASPTTTLALIEQGLQVFTAIYKRVYRAEKRELKKLFRLNGRFLPPKSYFTVLDEPEAIERDDYNDEGVDVVPVADPSVVSSMQKLARAQLLMEHKDDPYLDGKEVRRRFFEQAGVEDVDTLLVDELPPNPRMLEAADKIEVEKKKLTLKWLELEIKNAKTQAEIIKLLADAEGVEAGEQIEMYKTWMQSLIEKSKLEQPSGGAEAENSSTGS